MQPWTAPCSGTFKFEAWGASGALGAYAGVGDFGRGGYTSGNVNINKGKNIYAYVGGKGKTQSGGKCNDETYNTTVAGGWNGGGGYSSSQGGASGGGATDFRLVSGDWKNFDSLKSRVMVAAGGGSGDYATGGHAGGLNGGNGGITSGGSGHYYTIVTGPTQISVGSVSYSSAGTGTWNENDTLGGFGFGGHGAGRKCAGGGGGGGWYGGPGVRNMGAGGGGSSYISGHSGCRAINQSSTSGSIAHLSTSEHPDMKFESTVMKAGNESMPSPSGSTETGHNDNGYARITVVE